MNICIIVLLKKAVLSCWTTCWYSLFIDLHTLIPLNSKFNFVQTVCVAMCVDVFPHFLPLLTWKCTHRYLWVVNVKFNCNNSWLHIWNYCVGYLLCLCLVIELYTITSLLCAFDAFTAESLIIFVIYDISLENALYMT